MSNIRLSAPLSTVFAALLSSFPHLASATPVTYAFYMEGNESGLVVEDPGNVLGFGVSPSCIGKCISGQITFDPAAPLSYAGDDYTGGHWGYTDLILSAEVTINGHRFEFPTDGYNRFSLEWVDLGPSDDGLTHFYYGENPFLLPGFALSFFWGCEVPTGGRISDVCPTSLREIANIAQWVPGIFQTGGSTGLMVSTNDFWLHAIDLDRVYRVPEPATFVLFSLGILGLGFASRLASRAEVDLRKQRQIG